MKSLTVLALAGALSVSAQAADAASHNYALSGFDKVEASNHVRVIVRQGPYAISVDEPDNRFADLRLSVRDGVLVASRRDHYSGFWFGNWDPPRYTITVSAPAYSQLLVHDHARIEAKISAPVLRVTARDHGRLEGDFAAGRLEARASDHGHIRYEGRCQDLNVSASDHGDIDGAQLSCDLAEAQASGHGDLSVNALKTIRCVAYDHGDIWVHGPANVTNWQVSDHGSIRRL